MNSMENKDLNNYYLSSQYNMSDNSQTPSPYYNSINIHRVHTSVLQ